MGRNKNQLLMVQTKRLAELIQGRLTAEKYIDIISGLEALEKTFVRDCSMRAQAEKEMLHILQTTPMDDVGVIFWIAVMWRIFLREEYLQLLLESMLESRIINVYHLEFMYYQITYTLFNKPECRSDKVNDLLRRMYDEIGKIFDTTIVVPRRSRLERNPQKVVVMTAVFLGENHAPTHSLLERSYMLEKLFGVEVCIVSAKEGVYQNGTFPYYRVAEANCIESYSDRTEYEYKERKFQFYQGKKALDCREGLQELIDFVDIVNPYYILYIGGQSCIADLFNKFCPVITIATVFSTIPDCRTAFAMVGRSISQEERNKSKSEIIEVPFTFQLTEKKQSYTRRELGIPEEQFVMAVVGNRLDYDVKDEFLENMGQLEQGIFLFIGTFNTYEHCIEKFPWLKERSLSIGRVDDVIGILECADLYVNPKRLGGGFSVIEAFHAGVPAVSIAYGDVAVAAGLEFCVPNYEEMRMTIRRYQSDRAFYEEKLKKAGEREDEITNGEDAFREGINKILNSDKFY